MGDPTNKENNKISGSRSWEESENFRSRPILSFSGCCRFLRLLGVEVRGVGKSGEIDEHGVLDPRSRRRLGDGGCTHPQHRSFP